MAFKARSAPFQIRAKVSASPLTRRAISLQLIPLVELSLGSLQTVRGVCLLVLLHLTLTQAPRDWRLTGSAICSCRQKASSFLSAMTPFSNLLPKELRAPLPPASPSQGAWRLTEVVIFLSPMSME